MTAFSAASWDTQPGFFITGLESSTETRVSYVSKQHTDQQPTGNLQIAFKRAQTSVIHWKKRTGSLKGDPVSVAPPYCHNLFGASLAHTVLQTWAPAFSLHGSFREGVVIDATCDGV